MALSVNRPVGGMEDDDVTVVAPVDVSSFPFAAVSMDANPDRAVGIQAGYELVPFSIVRLIVNHSYLDTEHSFGTRAGYIKSACCLLVT